MPKRKKSSQEYNNTNYKNNLLSSFTFYKNELTVFHVSLIISRDSSQLCEIVKSKELCKVGDYLCTHYNGIRIQSAVNFSSTVWDKRLDSFSFLLLESVVENNYQRLVFVACEKNFQNQKIFSPPQQGNRYLRFTCLKRKNKL